MKSRTTPNPPGPDRAFKVRRIDYHAEESVFAHRIVRRPDLQWHLVVGAEIDRLDVAPGPQVPEVDLVAILVRQQVLRGEAVLGLRRQRPFARHHAVAWQVPPEVKVQSLRPAIDLPAAEDFERLAIHDEDAGRFIGAVLAATAQRADVDPFRSAMDGVRS